ncbi:MAG: ADYC domain-containing protein [Myxococcota bacterium]|nr:ADYC domain-containing protein [Myxococcota bacterium]
MRTLSRLALIPLVLAGCALEDAPEPTTSAVEQQLRCGDWMCGSNSPEIENLGIAELNIRGLPNANGFRLLQLDKNGITYRTYVTGGELRATSLDGASQLGGDQLTGATLRVKHDASELKYDIRIANVSKTLYWARLNGATHSTRTYRLEWSLSTQVGEKQWKNICSEAGTADPLVMDPFHAVLFEGDRIVASDKVVGSVDSDWFNIGCAGHALAKLHLTAHTEGARARGFATSLVERTTMLKMLTADYCGTGRPFTVAGVDLTWKDHRGWMVFDPALAPVEARWTAAGAACLNKPRLVANPTQLGTDQFGSSAQLEAAITKECPNGRPPTCAVTRTSYHLISGNP